LAGFGANLPVTSIDGIEASYASALHARGAHSLGDLAEIDPFRPIGDIPLVELREFRTKARLVTRLQINLAPFAPLAGHSVSHLLLQRPERVAGGVDAPGVTTSSVRRLQEELALLQVALDEAQLQSMTLGDLM
jgi:hypothetical protein